MLKKISKYMIFALFMVITFSWWLDSFKKSEDAIMHVMDSILELDNKNLSEVKNMLGDPLSVHREKVYTYKDSLATYDILIEKKVKSVVISLKNISNMSEQQVISNIGIREDIKDKTVTEKSGIKNTIIYNVANISKLEINSYIDNNCVYEIKVVY